MRLRNSLPITTILLVFVALLTGKESDQKNKNNSQQNVGPVVGHVDSESAYLLIRRGAISQRLRLYISDGTNPSSFQTFEVETKAEQDYVAKFEVKGLNPNTRYSYRIVSVKGKAETPLAEGKNCTFKTTSKNRKKGAVTLCFTSCVDIEDNPMWDDIKKVRPNMLVLVGDTPYIDSSKLEVARNRHRRFLAMAGLSELAQYTPTVGTWDDHDFGLNNGNGRNMKSGKKFTRQAFVEYRAHSQYGTGTEGVYHKADLGLIELFLLDPRYFSQTTASVIDPKQPTCFGEKQWEWLKESLKASKAPFKVLASGAIWQDKKNSETDDMFTYWYERDALFDLIKKENIPGVVLLGGDIHVSRHLVHPRRVGYDLHDFVISPGHERTITGLDVYHPSLRWSLVEGHQFLSLSATIDKNGPKLTAQYRQSGDRLNREVVLSFDQLSAPKRNKGLKRGLRAHWAFENTFTNSGALKNLLEMKPNPSPEGILYRDSKRGGVARFDRNLQQFLNVNRNPLDDNSDRHTYALWFRPSSLPRHGTTDRMFLIESTAEGKPHNKSAWHISLGLRSCDDPNKINLQLYTHTLSPASRPEAAPTAKSLGGFDCLIPRSELKKWNHVTCTFDSLSLSLYLNGKQIAKHHLPVPGPASEFGGLVIGGHREGKGRNFDGFIDDVAIWSRVLNENEIKKLQKRDSLK